MAWNEGFPAPEEEVAGDTAQAEEGQSETQEFETKPESKPEVEAEVVEQPQETTNE